MKIGKYILIGLGVIIIEWIFLSLFASFFNGLSQEGAVIVGSAFFLAFEMVICTGVIISKIEKKKQLIYTVEKQKKEGSI